MRRTSTFIKRTTGFLLALLLLTGAFCAQAESISKRSMLLALEAEIAELVEQIKVIMEQGVKFSYKGVTYTREEGADYARETLFGTEDYYPFYDALRDAAVAQSDKIGELFLREVNAYNAYARLLGYDGYVAYAADSYGYDESTPKIMDAILTLYPRSMLLILDSSYLRTGIDDITFLDHKAFMQELAVWYGEMDADYQTSLEELISSDRFTASPSSYELCGGYVTTYSGNDMLPVMHIDYCDDAIFSKTAVHECGHYIHDTHKVGKYDEKRSLAIDETHSLSGEFLLFDKLNDYYKKMTDAYTGDFLSFYTLYQQLLLFPIGAAEYLLVTDIFEHPESYTPSGIAEKYLQISFDMGFDAGFSPDYQILSGVEWINNKNMFDYPLYNQSYAIATLNALWLWREQEQSGDGVARYVNLVNTPVKDMPYVDYCVSVGLPDFTDPASHAGLDDFVADKLEALEALVYGEEE